MIDSGDPGAAEQSEDILSEAGFDVSPGLVAAGAPKGVRHTVIAYGAGQEEYARVVSTYFPGLKLVEVKGLAAPVAVVVFSGYKPSGQAGVGSGQGPAAVASARRLRRSHRLARMRALVLSGEQAPACVRSRIPRPNS